MEKTLRLITIPYRYVEKFLLIVGLPQKYVKKILRLMYQPYKWLFVIPMVGISMAVFGTGAIIASYFSKKAACLVFGGSWARFVSCITPMVLTVSGRENIDKKQSYVVVANHQSVYDMISIFGYLKMDLRWVMKKELRKVPFLGYSSVRVGNVFVDRSNTAAAIKSIAQAKETIRDGVSMMFFVEGTRSLTGRIGDLKKGAFIMALEMGLPILPVTVDGTATILPATTLDLFPGKARMIIHEPINTSEYSMENIDKLMARTKDTLASELTMFRD